MNVFLLPPLFLLGIALGVLALRSGSLLPGILLHGIGYAFLLLGSAWPAGWEAAADTGAGQYVVTALSTAAAAALLWWQNRRTGSGLFEALLAVPRPVTPLTPDADVDVACRPVPAKPQARQPLPDE